MNNKEENVIHTQDRCDVDIIFHGDTVSIEITDMNGKLISELRMNNNNFTKALVSNNISRGTVLMPVKEDKGLSM